MQCQIFASGLVGAFNSHTLRALKKFIRSFRNLDEQREIDIKSLMNDSDFKTGCDEKKKTQIEQALRTHKFEVIDYLKFQIISFYVF